MSTPRRAFTLIEVMLAIGLLMGLFAGLGMLSWELSTRRRGAIELAREQRTLGTFMDRVEDDLASSLAGDSALGAGVQGSAGHLRVLSRGVGIPVDATLGSVASREQLSDLRGAEYTFDPGNKTVSARRWVGTSGTGLPYPIGEGVELLRIRYFDGTQWTDTFDTLAAGSLPVAIEVSIWQTRFGPALPGAGDAPMSAGEGMAPPPLAGDPDEPIRAPDRVRLIAVPDGPTSGWKGGA